jgi:hypothetical protein
MEYNDALHDDSPTPQAWQAMQALLAAGDAAVDAWRTEQT